MLQKLISKWSFFKKRGNGLTQPLKEPLRKPSLSTKLYLSITELTLDKFITCICDGNLSVLVKGDWYGLQEGDIIDAWESLYAQYIDCIKDKEQQYITRLLKEINLLQTKLDLIQLIVTRLSIEHNQEILDELKKIIAVTGNFIIDDANSYLKDLERVVLNSKRLVVELENKKSEFEKLMPSSPAQKVDKQHFETVIIRVSKHMKFRVNKYEIMVSEFVAMIVDMRDTAEAMNRELNTLKR